MCIRDRYAEEPVSASHFWDLNHWIWLKSHVSLSGSTGVGVFPRIFYKKKQSVDDSNLSCFNMKVQIRTRKLEAFGCALLSGVIGWMLLKFAHFTSTSGPYEVPRENWSKKRYRSEFLQTSFIFVIHLFKGVSLCLVALFTDYLFLNLYVYEPIRQWAGLLPQLIFYSFFLRPVESVIKREKRKKHS